MLIRLQSPLWRVVVGLLILVPSNGVGRVKSPTTTVFGVASAARGAAHSPVVPALVILGDSTVDVGVNTHLPTLVTCNWPPYGRDFPTGKPTGRFCNGKLSTDFFADRLGLPYPLPFLDPTAHGRAVLKGINVASSGSGYLDLTATQLGVASLSQQIRWVKEWKMEVSTLVGRHAAAKIFEEGIYVVSTGSNDWLDNYYLNLKLRLVTTTTDYRHQLLGLAQQHLQNLYNLGARKVAVISLPPMGCVPFQIALYNGHGKCIEFMNTDSMAFNAGLELVIDRLKSLHGSRFVYLNAYDMTYDAFQNPANYGIAHSNTFESCCEDATVPGVGPTCNSFSTACRNASTYLFWDGFHPTDFFNRQLAEYLYSAVKKEFGLPH